MKKGKSLRQKLLGKLRPIDKLRAALNVAEDQPITPELVDDLIGDLKSKNLLDCLEIDADELKSTLSHLND